MSIESDLAGAVATWPECLPDVKALLDVADFEEQNPRAVFKACCTEDAARRTWTWATLAAALAHGKPNETAHWGDVLAGFQPVSPAQATHNAKLIHAAATKRRLDAMLRGAIADLDETSATEDDVERFSSELASKLASLTEKTATASSDLDAGDMMLEAIARLRAPQERSGLDTGLSDLDRMLLGMRPGETYVFAGRTGMGKSVFGQQIAINVAKAGHKTTFVNLEMASEEVGDRSLCIVGNVFSEDVRGKTLDKDTLAQVEADAREVKRNGTLRYVTENYITFAKLRAILRRHARKHGLEFAVIDYMQLVRIPGYGPKERQLEVSDVSKSLKQLAKELAIPILALAQLSRDAERGEPSLAHLRESGSIEMDADVVVLLSGERNSSELTADVAKNRHGRTGPIKLSFVRAKYRIELLSTWNSEVIYDGRS